MFKPTTVDGAIAGLIKAQDNLETVAAARLDAVRESESKIQTLQDQVEVDRAEASRATAVLSKLISITEG